MELGTNPICAAWAYEECQSEEVTVLRWSNESRPRGNFHTVLSPRRGSRRAGLEGPVNVRT